MVSKLWQKKSPFSHFRLFFNLDIFKFSLVNFIHPKLELTQRFDVVDSISDNCVLLFFFFFLSLSFAHSNHGMGILLAERELRILRKKTKPKQKYF